MSDRNLLVKLLGDSSSALKAMKETEGGATGMGSKLVSVGKMAAAGVAAVGAAAIAFGADSVKAFDTTAKAVAKLQRLTGGTAEDMSHLAFEAKETGVSQESLEKAVTKMSKALASNSKDFADHGIVTRDAAGNLLPMNEIMANTADVFAGMKDGAEKTALAVKLFGKAGADMIPMLDQGKAGLEEMAGEADKFGVTIGQDGVDAYKKNVKNSREMHAAMEGLKIQIGEKLMPIIVKITTWLAQNLPVAIAFVKKVIEALKPTFEAIGETIARLVVWWKAHWDQIRTTVETVIGYIRGFIDTAVAAIEMIWRNFGDNILSYLESAWELIKGVFTGAFEVIQGLFDFFRDLFTGKWGKLWGDVKEILTGVWDVISAYVQYALDLIVNALDVAWKVIKEALTLAWDAIKAYFTLWWDALKLVFTTAIDAVKSALSAAWDGIKTAATAVWDGIKAYYTFWWDAVKLIFTTAVDAVKSALSAAWDAIKNTATAVWDGIKSAASTVWDGIKTAIMFPINTARDLIATVWDGIKNAASTAWSTLKDAASTAWDLIKTAVTAPIDAAKTVISGIWDAIVSTVQGLPGKMSSALSGLADLITAPFKAAFNGIAKVWNSTVGSLSFSIPSWVPGIGGDGFSMPKIPTFHTGGRVPGVVGQEVLAVLKAGETVRTVDQEAALGRRSDGPSVVQHFHGVTGDSEVAKRSAREVGWALRAA